MKKLKDFKKYCIDHMDAILGMLQIAEGVSFIALDACLLSILIKRPKMSKFVKYAMPLPMLEVLLTGGTAVFMGTVRIGEYLVKHKK